MYKQKVILIGPCGDGSVPKNGASAKNYHLVKFLKGKNINISTIDTENWRKNPLVLVRLLFMILGNPKAKFIIATDNRSGYRLIKFFDSLPLQYNVSYWVIGGSIASSIERGEFDIKPYKSLDSVLVEGEKMRKQFAKLGVENTIYVPNFKNIEYIPPYKTKVGDCLQFVFLSRIIPRKGCRIIIEAAKLLNKNYKNKFSVSFYGPFEESYENEFYDSIKDLPNVNYCGFLNFSKKESYDKLAKFDAMLFPTFWPGEGFPGVLIDAFISGLPVIATDWSLNSDLIIPNETGWLIEPESVDSLYKAMRDIIEDPSKIVRMKGLCSSKAMQYDTASVINNELLKKIGIKI